MSKKLAWFLALMMALLPLAVAALGLGEIKLHSGLNQTLNADIPIVGAASDELDSLQIKLASPEQFRKAGLDYPAVLTKLKFQVVRRSDGSAYIHVTSPNVIREPFLDFLIDATWDNGELLREYTVLLNPPNFESAAKPAAPVATPAKQPAPAQAPTTPAPSATAALVAPQTPAAQPAAAPVKVPAPTTTPVTPMPAPAAQSAPTALPAAPTATVSAMQGTDYGPIHRGETLSEIANKLRPSGVTLNQMMIALYRANPEVFMHNINRMKAGYVMRIPSMSDVQAITVVEANSEVRTQIQAWRASRGLGTAKPASSETKSESKTPALQLVAPSSAAQTAENQLPGAGSGGTATNPGKPAVETPETTAKTNPIPPPLPTASSSTSQAPVAIKSSALAAAQNQAAILNKQPENKGLPLPGEKPAETKPLATKPPVTKSQVVKPHPAVASKPAKSGGIVDTLLGALGNIYILIAIAVVVILILIGVVMKKRRASSGAAKPVGAKRISGANWSAQEQAGAEDLTAVAVTTRTKARKVKGKAESAMPVPEPVMDNVAADETPAEDKTVMVSPPEETAAPVKLDDSDPAAEADFHMAYGLYDQAADVLRKGLKQSPGNRALKLKLLEVFFTAGDAANFVEAARSLRKDMGDAPDKDWESVAIMGRQVAPGEALFAATGTGSSAGTASSVDIALDGGGTDTMVSDLDPLAGAFGTAELPPTEEAHAGTEILSADALESTPVAAPEAAQDNSLEFSLPDIESPPSTGESASPEAAPAASSETGMEFDLGEFNIEPTPSEKKPETAEAAPKVDTDFGTDSQVEFDKALDELSSFVSTNVPPQEEQVPAVAENLGSGLSLDGEMPSMESSAAPVEDAGAASLSEVGTKLDLARAYIDMGDPDGAKNILDEVMEEGTAQQKQEAQELMKHLA